LRSYEVFWVRHGILRSTDLRDSMDEQCIADILACIVGGQIITRSKDALDAIYHEGEDENKRILDGLNAYGATRITEEFKYCIDEIDKICNVDGFEKLKNILYKDKNSNAFPSVFAVLFISLHESFVKDNKMISDYIEARKAISGMLARIDERRRAGAPDARRRDINAVRGLLSSCLIDSDDSREIYGSNSTVDIENSIRRSEAELANYELKQGLLSLSGKERNIDLNIINKVCKTICAIANNGPKRGGKIFIGVADKQSDVDKIIELDNKITPKKIGQRSVVGVRREAIFLSITIQEYVSKWKDGISNSELSLKLKNDVLSTLDYHDFYGLGIIIITIPPQSEISYFGDDTYYRNVDSTQKAEGARLIGMIASRFLFA